jgi:hypothetical protein
MTRHQGRLLIFSVALAIMVWIVAADIRATPAHAAAGEVLILDTTVIGGASSLEAQKVVAAGKTPVVVSEAQWASMTTADFAAYDAIVLGDPNCVTNTGPVAAAEANAAEWGAAIDGNVVLIGSDPYYHRSQGGEALTEKGIAFAVGEFGKTGAYITLSCYYHWEEVGTAVPLLDGISGGGFTVRGGKVIPSLNDVAIVATHPALDGLTNADLSNWGNSVHEAFDTWPLDFEVLAIARDATGTFTAPDGTRGFPYIIARGVEILSDIALSPETAVNSVGASHTVTATVTTDDPLTGTPLVGTTVTFTIIDGPHSGVTEVATTDGNGEAVLTYIGTTEGVDTIEATFIDELGRTQRSNRVTATWVEALVVDPGDGTQGCTPGFWRNNGAYVPGTDALLGANFWTLIGVVHTDDIAAMTRQGRAPGVSADLTIQQALELEGGQFRALIRHAAAALLNASTLGADYPHGTAEVETAFAAAITGGNHGDALSMLEDANELGCGWNARGTRLEPDTEE